MEEFTEQAMIDELRRQIKLIDKPFITLNAKNKQGQSYIFEGYKICSCVVSGNNKSFVFQVQEGDIPHKFQLTYSEYNELCGEDAYLLNKVTTY